MIEVATKPKRRRKIRSEAEAGALVDRRHVREWVRKVETERAWWKSGRELAQNVMLNSTPPAALGALMNAMEASAEIDTLLFLRGFAQELYAITWLKSMPYAEYLKTPWWANRRNMVLSRWNGRCALDTSHQATEVHHRTYERRGFEALDDLIPLCSACHRKFHGKG